MGLDIDVWSYLSVILSVLVVLFFAGNILVGKAINDLPPFTIAFFRLLIAFIILLPIGLRSAWTHRQQFITHWKPFLIITLTGITFFNTFLYGALQFTSSTNVSVLESVIPAVTVILSVLFLNEKLRKLQWLGVGISLFGALWVVMDGHLLELGTMDWNIGDVIMIGAIFSWSIYSLVLGKYIHLFPQYGILFVMTGISVIVLFPIMLVEWLLVGLPSFGYPNLWAGLLYLGIFPSVIAILCYNRVVNIIGAAQAAMFLNFLPVATMLGAFFWLEETITWMQIIGAAIVITGVTMTTRGDKAKRMKPVRK